MGSAVVARGRTTKAAIPGRMELPVKSQAERSPDMSGPAPGPEAVSGRWPVGPAPYPIGPGPWALYPYPLSRGTSSI